MKERLREVIFALNYILSFFQMDDFTREHLEQAIELLENVKRTE